MDAPQHSISFGYRMLIEKIRQQILLRGRAHIGDLGAQAAEPIRVLQSLDLVERVGDELRLVKR
jgi:hypothetical protein